MDFDMTAVIFNFVDILSHARTELEMIKELAYDEPSYRSLTRSWFEHSHLYDFLKELSTFTHQSSIDHRSWDHPCK